jgi:hypothetical protein
MSLDNRRLALNVHRSSSSPVPTVHIFLQRVVRQANGMLAVTPVCSSLPEIEGEIEGLRIELEEVLRQARAAYGTKRAPTAGARLSESP